MKFAALQNPAVFDLLNRIFAAQLPVKVAYRLSKIQKVIGSEAEKYNELRIKIIKKYAQLDDAGEMVTDESGNVKIQEDQSDALVAEMNELHDITVDLPGKVSLDDLEKIELSSYDLSMLEALEILEE